MTKFIGQVASKPERRDGRWFFFVWNAKARKGINCISSVRFEVDNREVPLAMNPLDEVEVIGEETLGTCYFDCVSLLKAAEQAETH